MSITLRQLMEERSAGIVGRQDEMASLHSLLGEGGPLVAFVHGIAGVGKSALAEAFAVQARSEGATVLRLDCRVIEPTERGFISTLALAIGSEPTTTPGIATRLSRLGQRVVLVLDTYEVLRLLDLWLRQTFVPALTDNVRVILVGREPPVAAWPGALGVMFRRVPVGNLSREDAECMLRQAGVDPTDTGRIDRIARGHPLSLTLAAAAWTERSSVNLSTVTMQAIVEELTELFLDALDPLTRQALDAAAVVRRPTLSLLAAMLPDAAPQDAFDRMRRLPFVELSDDGLVLHDTVREAVAALLRSSDPDRSQRYRAAAWRRLRDEVARASNQEMWRYTADLLYILQNPIVREAFFPTTEHLYSVETAKAHDAGDIAAIAARWEPAGSVAILDTWWRTMPEAFRVVRDVSGSVVGFYTLLAMDRLTHRLLDADPVARHCWDHLKRYPVPRGQLVLLSRGWIARDLGEAPSPVQAATWLDTKQTYMELRPDLRRIYSVVRDLATFGPMVVPLGFEPLPGAHPQLDGVTYHVAQNDFGPASIDGWLAGLVAAELHIDEDQFLDVAQRQLIVDGRRIGLTKLETDVLHYLYQRQRKVVSRSALLRDVWGYDYAGGSNVVDVVIRALRQKLASRADSIETVRGLGYRFVARV